MLNLSAAEIKSSISRLTGPLDDFAEEQIVRTQQPRLLVRGTILVHYVSVEGQEQRGGDGFARSKVAFLVA